MTRVFAAMNRARLIRSLSSSGLALAVVISCSKAKDTQDFVPSQRGAVQPDAGGPQVSEADACTQLKKAESSARAALSCDPVTRECPDYIRPAGGADCFEYSQASITGCQKLYESFTSCSDFDAHLCLIAAVSNCDAPPDDGEAGAGGAAGAPSTPEGEAGTPGAAGETAAGAGGA